MGFFKTGGEAATESPVPEKAGRERWSSRAAFYMAAVGFAVGFGNVWRFPSLVFTFGGGAFFIPYVLALFFVGIPILVLEVALGQFYETGDVGVFGSIHQRLRGVGVASVASALMLVTYYSMLLAWVCNAFFSSFKDNFWAQEAVTGPEARDYFYNSIIGMETLGDDLRPTRLIPENVGYSFLTWTIIYACIAFGLKWTGRITYFTMGLPIILLFVFLGRAVTLEGAQLGIEQYLNSNWDVLTDQPQVWAAAVTQIFFSLGITFGVMTSYGSHCKANEPAFKNSCVIAISNCLFSFIAGFAVFATLGYLATLEGYDSVSELEFTSFGLVFGSWPVALGTLPGGEHWVRLLFVMLFLLGIDSAFAFMEGFLTVAQDTALFRDVDRRVLSFGVTVVCFLFSIMYATDAGLIFLDVVDYYINFVMLLVGGFECVAAGWVYNIEKQVERTSLAIVSTYFITTFGSVICACAVWFGMKDGNNAVWAGFVTLVAFYFFGMAVVTFLVKKEMQVNPEKTMRGMYWDIMMRNVMELRDDLSAKVGYLPAAWAFLIKHFIPPVIIVLFSLGADAENANGDKVFGHYGGYVTWPYQVLGILVVVFSGFLFVSSLIVPGIYESLQLKEKTTEATYPASAYPATDADEEGGDVDNIHTADVEVCAKEVMAEEVTA